jgi:carboxyl-terminal processing protease
VSDVKVDGVRLEGVGVAPDVEAKRDLAYCNGQDEQLDAGIAELITVVNQAAGR